MVSQLFDPVLGGAGGHGTPGPGLGEAGPTHEALLGLLRTTRSSPSTGRWPSSSTT